ncbi:MAG: hypothetical protein HQK91_04740 [Nitrospirae bacterium]|nr:hypothetical protein [Nitrospirota bacterium]
MNVKRSRSNESSKTKKVLKRTEPVKTICINKECRLRVKGCKGFEGCPGYKTI